MRLTIFFKCKKLIVQIGKATSVTSYKKLLTWKNRTTRPFTWSNGKAGISKLVRGSLNKTFSTSKTLSKISEILASKICKLILAVKSFLRQKLIWILISLQGIMGTFFMGIVLSVYTRYKRYIRTIKVPFILRYSGIQDRTVFSLRILW